MLTMLSEHVIVCLDSLKDQNQKSMLIEEITSPVLNVKAREILPVTQEEVNGMCVNMFNLLDDKGQNTLIMSDRARRTYPQEVF